MFNINEAFVKNKYNFFNFLVQQKLAIVISLSAVRSSGIAGVVSKTDDASFIRVAWRLHMKRITSG